jgi:predicted tellurium resistance membrane protein TerC
MGDLFTSGALLALVTLSALEIVLGIDNIVFITILTGRLPADRQAAARRVGLVLALGMRIGLLGAIAWIMGLTRPLFAVWGQTLSGRDLILLAGGLFLLFKATWEIYDKLEVEHLEAEHGSVRPRRAFASVIVQILLLDLVFSLDSVITAVGMASQVPIMVAAMVIAMLVMLASMEGLAGFLERHPSLKMLALAFLLLIGVMLVLEGMGQHVPKGYIYFAMAFSLGVDVLNIRYRTRRRPVELHHRFEDEKA